MQRTGSVASKLALAALAALGGVLVSSPPALHAQENQDDVEYTDVLNRDTPIDADKMLQIWAKRLQVLIIVDPQMQGVKIKFLQSDVKLTWGLFKKVLDFYDIVLEEKSVNGKWVMFAHLRRNLAQKAAPPFRVTDEKGLGTREEIVTAVIQVTNGAGNDIFATVRGLLVRDVNRIGNILYVRGPEVIIIVDYSSNVEYYLKIIQRLDVQAPGQLTRVLQINFAPAEDISRVIQSLLRSGAGGGPGGVPQPVGLPGGGGLLQPQVIADTRTNKLIVQAYKHQFDEIDRMIRELDVKAPSRPPTFHIYKCKNVDAQYLAGKLQELFTGGGGGGGSKRRSSSGGAGGTNKAGGPQGAGAPAPGGFGSVNVGNNPSQSGGKGDFSGIDTRIVADELSNSLLIQCEEPIWRQILTLLEGGGDVPGLDRPRRRVLIEAQIWEVSTPTDNMTIGFELAAVDNAHQGSVRPAGLTNFGLSQVTVDTANQRIGRIPNLTSGFTAALTKDTFDKLPVIVQAIASFETSKIITTPFALTNDNTEAVFEINNKIPFQTSTITTGIAQGNVQFTDVKTALTVTPQVNSEDNLTLVIDVQLSTIGAAGSATLPPSTNERHYKGEVTVPNMKYVVFGGLESESYGTVESKVPYLGDIPILGHLFKQKTWSHSKAKIYIFIRPTIFLDDRALGRVSEDARERIHIAAERDEWVPPIVGERFLKNSSRTLQDDVFEVFGAGTGNPFPGSLPRED